MDEIICVDCGESDEYCTCCGECGWGFLECVCWDGEEDE